MGAALSACMTLRWASHVRISVELEMIFRQKRESDIFKPFSAGSSGGRSLHQDQLLPLLPLPLPGPLRQPLGERAPPEGEGAGGGQDQDQDGLSGLEPSAV